MITSFAIGNSTISYATTIHKDVLVVDIYKDDYRIDRLELLSSGILLDSVKIEEDYHNNLRSVLPNRTLIVNWDLL